MLNEEKVRNPDNALVIEELKQGYLEIAQTLSFLPDATRLDFAFDRIEFAARKVVIVLFDLNEPRIEGMEREIEKALGVELIPENGTVIRATAVWYDLVFATCISDQPLDAYDAEGR